MSKLHTPTRIQHELVRRVITVVSVEDVTPRMRRIVFESESLKTLQSLGHDDHIKIFFHADSKSPDQSPIARDFTPRKIDSAHGRLTIDFALHDAGPATSWARQAKAGDTLDIGGPRGSLVVPDDFDWYLLIGDETALPAIGRRLEELRAGVPVTSVVIIAEQAEQQNIHTAADWAPIWMHRDAGTESDELLIRRALETMTFPRGDGYIWLAGESGMIRSLRAYLVNDRSHPAEWVRAAGYWKRGSPGAHDRI